MIEKFFSRRNVPSYFAISSGLGRQLSLLKAEIVIVNLVTGLLMLIISSGDISLRTPLVVRIGFKQKLRLYGVGNCGSPGFDFRMTAGLRWHCQALPLSTVSPQPGLTLSSALAGPQAFFTTAGVPHFTWSHFRSSGGGIRSSCSQQKSRLFPSKVMC